jgi:hypothetical protein
MTTGDLVSSEDDRALEFLDRLRPGRAVGVENSTRSVTPAMSIDELMNYRTVRRKGIGELRRTAGADDK